jgi:hypothetical protein
MEIDLRLECLKMAQERFPDAHVDVILDTARLFYNWVTGDKKD